MVDMSEEKIRKLREMAKRIRLTGLDMALASANNGSHLGGSFSCVEIMAVLYGEVLKLDAANPRWDERDRFLPSKNHCVLSHLPALAEAGFIPRDELFEFQSDGGRMTGYPYNPEIGLEYSGGTLGMALSVGIGMAIACREKKRDSRIYVLLGDGELNEGSIWEAVMSAAQYKLDNLVVIVDRNHLSYDGDTEEVMALEPLAEKWRCFNWHVETCDGHDVAGLLQTFSSIEKAEKGKPHVILADTVKGKGVSFMENRPEWHHSRITKEQYEQARQEIEEAD